MCDLSCLEQFALILHCEVQDAVYVLSNILWKLVERILLNRHPDVFEERLLYLLAIVITLLTCIFIFWGACFESMPRYYFKVFTFFSSDCLCRSWYIYYVRQSWWSRLAFFYSLIRFGFV